jgi:hypothetical protein
MAFLHDHITPSGKRRILKADESGFACGQPSRVLGPVDKTQKIAGVEVTETVHLVHNGNCASEALDNLRSELEAKVEMLGANVKKEIPWCGDGVAAGCADLAERAQLCRSRPAEEPVPRVAPDPHDA